MSAAELSISPAAPPGLLGSLTVRGRLAAIYGAIFFASGALLLTITYLFLDRGVAFKVPGGVTLRRLLSPVPFSAASGVVVKASPVAAQITDSSKRVAVTLLAHQHAADLSRLLLASGVALALMTLVSVGLGRVVAGRVLRPLRTITSVTRQISERSLHRRLALSGPRDELTELSDTIDALLARLEAAFSSERTFVANAAHELRTPLALERSILQVALADPDVSLESLRTACEEAIDVGRHQEALIEALLTLARSQRGLDTTTHVDLGRVAREVVVARAPGAAARAVEITVSAVPASVPGDARLLERLVANLVDNAVRYNRDSGSVTVSVRTDRRGARLEVTNSGPVVPPSELGRLLRPFQRLARDRTGDQSGLGLGLSIVDAIARAHGAELTVNAPDGGGLRVAVRFRHAAADLVPVPLRRVPAADADVAGDGPSLASGDSGHRTRRWQ